MRSFVVGSHYLNAKSRRASLASLLGLAALVLCLTAAQPAWAAVSLTVTTTADIAANAGDCGNSSTAVPSPLSLREATCIANNYGNSQAVTINIPAGHYTLTSGELQPGKVSGSNVSLVGAGSATTVIDGNNNSRVLDFDSNLVGGLSNTVSNLTITGGKDDTFGGAGIIAGSNLNSSSDSLTLTNVVVTGNHANVASPNVTNRPGGAVQFEGGQLTVTNSTFSNNSAGSSQGAGLFYLANGAASPESLTITGSTFSGNSNVGSSGNNAAVLGGALVLSGTATSTYSVTNSHFTGNAVTANSGSGSPAGGAILELSGVLTLSGSTFTSNSASGGTATPRGGAVDIEGSAVANLHYNRFTGNTSSNGSAVASTPTISASENWWGCNTGPGTVGCDTISGSVTATPRLVLTATASPANVVHPSTTSTITGSLLTDSAGSAVSASNLTPAFDGLLASFADPPGDATVGGSPGAHTVGLSGGTASIGYQAGTVLGPDNVSVTLDNATATASLEVDEPPAITSADHASFAVGSAGSFSITTTGYPAATLSRSGVQFPAWLTLTDNGDGTGSLSGTPPAGSGSTYQFTVKAANGFAPSATQTFTLTVDELPAFTSADHTTFQVGSAGTFTVTTIAGFPAATTLTETGALPSGVSFTDNGDGTATLAGTPAAGTGGSYPLTLTATNTGGHTDQSFTLTVTASALITSADHTTFLAGSSGTFTVTTAPTATSVTESGSLPSGVTFHDNGDGTATLSGTPAAGTGGSYALTVTASNGIPPNATQNFTLTVNEAPSITSANHATFTVGSAGMFTLTTHAGFPTTTTLTETGALPSGVSFTDNGDGTATLAGTPAAGSGGSYPLTITAANGVLPDATQAFTLTVGAAPTITSADHTTFAVGSAGTFTVTTTAGTPAATTLSETGALPSGVSFTDNGNGTATLAGTPAAGTGGSYSLTVRASNGSNADQAFTLTVNERPSITSANSTTLNVGVAGTFTVTTQAGFPTATTLTETGALPAGVSFTDNGDGTATLAGTPAAGTNGTYSLTFTATNTAGHTDQAFTLTVGQSATTTTVTSSLNPSQLGQTVTFTATVSSSSPLTPGGTVTFYDGATTLGSRTLSGGHATLSLSTLSIGFHTIKVTYGGDAGHLGSSSASPFLTQLVDTNISRYLSGGVYNLAGRNLKGSFLVGANLDYGKLAGGNFESANISLASIRFANLKGANFKKADLHQSDLSRSDLSGANFTGTNLNNAVLVGANLSKTNFGSAMLKNANLNGAKLDHTNFDGANLLGATLVGATFSQVNWRNTICPDGTNSNNNVGRSCVGHF